MQRTFAIIGVRPQFIGAGANELVDADRNEIVNATRCHVGRNIQDVLQLYGGDKVVQNIVNKIVKAR